MSQLCKAGGILGYKTNHSLQVTTVTRLFQSGIDEQLIMSRTGHRSIDGIRKYKRISNEQKEATSEVLNSATNGEPLSIVKKSKLSKEENDDSCTSVSVVSSTQVAVNNSFNSSVRPTSSSAMVPNITFNSCSSVTINYYVK